MTKGELRVNTLYAGRRGGRFLALGGDGANDVVSLPPEASSQKNGRFCRGAIVRLHLGQVLAQLGTPYPISPVLVDVRGL
jgi:hypothetical protein